MAHLVSELSLPDLDVVGLERQEAIAAIEAARSVHWLARNELGYTVTRLQDVTAILRDQRFHSALSMIEQSPEFGASSYGGERRQSILTMEGEGHARLRRLVAPAFTPASANRLRPTMRKVVGELVGRVVDQGECELVADVCEPYPIPIICELLGAPPEDWKLFSAWATDIFRIFNNNLAEDLPLIERAGEELTAYVSDLIAERRADPRDDLLSDLIAIEQDGDRLSTDEMKGNQLRLYFSALAYTMMEALRRLGLKDTDWAQAQVDTIRLKLFKIGAIVRISARRIVLQMSSAYPWKDIYACAFHALRC